MRVNLPKTLPRRALYIVATTGVITYLAIVLSVTLRGRAQTNTVTPAVVSTTIPKQKQVVYGFPVRLKIPKINVDAALDYVRLTSTGALGVPSGPNNAAWYDQGPRPGEKGSAVIDGHFGYKHNIPAVFDNLHKLQIGDSVYVVDEKGTTITFVVKELKMYSQNESAASVFKSSDGQAHLNLITCQGVWNQAKKSYSNRLVVFTDKQDG